MADTFGRYTLLKQLGTGGMATIHLASFTGIAGFQKLVALKKIFPHLSESEEFIDMLVTEARIAVELTHPNICQIYDLGQLGGDYFIAMEFLHGKDVFNLISRCVKTRQALSTPLACYITQQVLEALEHAHKKRNHQGELMGIVHRDVSPRNIIITYDGQVKLIDFGIAKASTLGRHTQAGLIKGKLAYMSPEQACCEPLDRRSDLFSIGLVLYELLHLRPLFGGSSDLATLEQVRSCRLPAFRACNPELPEELELILMRALAADPAGRYQSAHEFSRDLQHFILSQHILVGPAELAAFMRGSFANELHSEERDLKRFLQGTPARATPVSPPSEGAAVPGQGEPDDLSSLLEDIPSLDSSPAVRARPISAAGLKDTVLFKLEPAPDPAPARISGSVPVPPWDPDDAPGRPPRTPAPIEEAQWLSDAPPWEKLAAEPATGPSQAMTFELDWSSHASAFPKDPDWPLDPPRAFDRPGPLCDDLDRRLDPPSRWPTEPGLTAPGSKEHMASSRPGDSSPWPSLSAVVESPSVDWTVPPSSFTQRAERRFTSLDRQTGFNRTHLTSRSTRPASRRGGNAGSSQHGQMLLRAIVVIAAALLLRRLLF